ncbi:hypothetical protein [Flavobacterium geliluteum]|uniref:Uncharacterized protein n=1 Tax=Flavobacterium geliluteum TaxID=2816120 RepID=A0A940X6C7_9FLAO|nr:hypothetical protein [Flavobacterium geliluteum]MBP4136755.1 hypothetical protein [Flavobacterium geliluteum]
MKIKIIVACILMPLCMACQNKKSDNHSNIAQYDTVKKNNSMKNSLEKQLNRGYRKYFNEAGVEISQETFDLSDIDITVQMGKKILISNGYNFIPTNKFYQKIKDIFDRIIEPNSDKSYLYVNYFDDCDRKFNYYPFDGTDHNGTYIIKRESFIIDFYFIPQLIDYKKEFPEVIKLENSINKKYKNKEGEEITIELWKEFPDLSNQRKNNIQTLVARNMYLFNDSRAHFKWLILNDEYFMQSLVTTFGYYEDKELLKWVIENTKFDKRNPKDLDQIFWNKNCNGTVKLNLEIFPVLKEIIKPNGVDYFEALKQYVMYLLEDKEKRNELSIADRSKLLAHLVYFGEQYRYDKNYNNQSFFMQRIALFDLDESIEKEIERNNFYNLLNYKNLYEKSEEYQNALADENGG